MVRWLLQLRGDPQLVLANYPNPGGKPGAFDTVCYVEAKAASGMRRDRCLVALPVPVTDLRR